LVGPLGVVKEPSKHEALKVLAQITAIGNGWLSAFSECDDLKSEILMLSQMLQDACGKLDVSLAEVEKAIEPYMDYEPGDYALSH
jgi:hypothetical protein